MDQERVKDREGGEAEKGSEEEGAGPKISPSPEGEQEGPPVRASRSQGPSLGNPCRGTPASASPPGLGEEGEGVSATSLPAH